MGLGLLVGLAADRVGTKRSLCAGLVLLGLSSIAGAWARDGTSLLILRGLEGCGLLLATLPAPALIRRLVPSGRLKAVLGWWGAYMPMGVACGLLAGPWVIGGLGWQAWWLGLGALSLLSALGVGLAVAAEPPGPGPGRLAATGRHGRLRQTLVAPGPWLIALSFAAYSAQWLAVIGFLPTVYAQAGIGGAVAGALTALAAAANVLGNVAAGRLLARGMRPALLQAIGFAGMAVASTAAFAELGGLALPAAGRYAAVVLFSALGGLVPATLFSLVLAVAPSEQTVSTTVGWAQQWSSFGQFAGPPVVAWIAGHAGGWQWTWVATAGCSGLGMALAALLARRMRARAAIS